MSRLSPADEAHIDAINAQLSEALSRLLSCPVTVVTVLPIASPELRVIDGNQDTAAGRLPAMQATAEV